MWVWLCGIKKLRKQFFLLYLHCMNVFLCLSIEFVLKSKVHYIHWQGVIFFWLNKIFLGKISCFLVFGCVIKNTLKKAFRRLTHTKNHKIFYIFI